MKLTSVWPIMDRRKVVHLLQDTRAVVQSRKEIVPVNRKWPLASLMTALQDLFPRSSSRNSHARHVLIEYVMLAGVNDSLEDAHRCESNLIKTQQCGHKAYSTANILM